MARIKGNRRLADQSVVLIDRLLLWQEPSVDHALKMCRRPVFAGHSDKDTLRRAIVNDGLLRPTPEKMAAMLARSDVIVDDAIARNPALARKASWTREDDGMYADAALVAIGDDRPCFNRRRRSVAESAGDRRKRIVISTDCNKSASMEMAASVVATIRIVQQWQPVEVWWQGAWLNQSRDRGYVFHVPLVDGDMDFTKIMFFLASQARDSFSLMLMMTESVDRGYYGWNGCQHQAERSYLNDTDHFIDHHGIPAQAVECYAAWWLGMPPAWRIESEESAAAVGALQEIKVPRAEVPETAEQRKEREASVARYREERKREDSARAASRAASLS